jgi:hypothetical protein
MSRTSSPGCPLCALGGVGEFRAGVEDPSLGVEADDLTVNGCRHRAAVALEAKAATADAACRQPAQDLAFTAAAPQLQAYVTRYRA